jgi:hypothetical protein
MSREKLELKDQQNVLRREYKATPSPETKELLIQLIESIAERRAGKHKTLIRALKEARRDRQKPATLPGRYCGR